ncbi:MAG: VOC family protein [Acidithiobacillus ferriphilus]|jgi:extradiol dioxygenase family protein
MATKLCLVNNNGSILYKRVSINMKLSIDHIVLNIEEISKSIDFYTGVLLLQSERLSEYQKNEAPFPSVRINSDTIIDLFPKHMWATEAQQNKGQGNLNHFCLAMSKEDWVLLTERLQSNGIRIEAGPVNRFGANGVGTSIYFRDPDGNQIEARYYSKEDAADSCLLGS